MRKLLSEWNDKTGHIKESKGGRYYRGVGIDHTEMEKDNPGAGHRGAKPRSLG